MLDGDTISSVDAAFGRHHGFRLDLTVHVDEIQYYGAVSKLAQSVTIGSGRFEDWCGSLPESSVTESPNRR